jgi:hypothetical protein
MQQKSLQKRRPESLIARSILHGLAAKSVAAQQKLPISG